MICKSNIHLSSENQIKKFFLILNKYIFKQTYLIVFQLRATWEVLKVHPTFNKHQPHPDLNIIPHIQGL